MKGGEPRTAPAVSRSLPRLPRGVPGVITFSFSPTTAAAGRRNPDPRPGLQFRPSGQPLPWRAGAPRRPHEVPRAPSMSGFRGFHDEACAGVIPAAAAHARLRPPAQSLRGTATWTVCPACAGASVAGPHTRRPTASEAIPPTVTPSWLCMSSSSENTSRPLG